MLPYQHRFHRRARAAAFCVALTALASLALASLATAAEDQAQPGMFTQGATISLSPDTVEDNSTDLVVRLDAGYVGSADFLNYRGSGFEAVPVTLALGGSAWSVGYTYTSYIWHGLDGLPFGGGSVPWYGLHTFRADYRFLKGTFLDDFYYRLAASANMGFETAPPGCVGLGLTGELAYDIYHGWMLGVLLSGEVLSPLNNDLLANFGVELVLYVSRTDLIRALTYFGVDPDQSGGDVSFRFGYTSRKQVYGLAANSPVEHNGYVAIERSTLHALVDVALGDGFTLSAGPEFLFWRKYSIYDSGGSRQNGYDLNESLGGRLELSFAF